MSGPRSPWPARSVSTVTTSPARTGATTLTGLSSRSSARTAAATGRTAKPANPPMALNRDYIGRSFPPSEPYEVSRVKIAEFADAIGDPSPLCRDRDAARAAGYPDVVAPPTFAIVITMANSSYAVMDQDLGLDYSMVVHGEQRFEHARPLHAGDVV